MKKFKKIVLMDGAGFPEDSLCLLEEYAEQVVNYDSMPESEEEKIRRIGDADAVLLSFRSQLRRNVIEACPNIRYIGMCSTLFSKESANVDIYAAEEKGIVVKGIKDYGDQGVVEFVIARVLDFFHGWNGPQWKPQMTELTGLPVGIAGLGTTGIMVAKALKVFGADVYYFSRTRKEDLEQELGITYLPLDQFLSKVEIMTMHLTKFTNLMGPEEFHSFGDGKIIINTSLGPLWDREAMKVWLENPSNYYICDSCGMGDCADLYQGENVLFVNKVAGTSMQSVRRLAQKATDNVKEYLLACE